MNYAQKIELRAKMQIARNMILANEPKEKVLQFTGLMDQQVEQIIQENKEALKNP